MTKEISTMGLDLTFELFDCTGVLNALRSKKAFSICYNKGYRLVGNFRKVRKAVNEPRVSGQAVAHKLLSVKFGRGGVFPLVWIPFPP